MECRFAIRVMGELGLRAGELSHISEDWVDFDYSKIEIPSYWPCDRGTDGDVCGYCKKRARSYAEVHNVPLEDAKELRWEPKLAASARTVPYDWSDSLVDLIEEFFIEYDRWPTSRVGINRRVDRVAEATPVISKNDVYPHALRARAAKFHAKNDLGAFMLKRFMGWENVAGAKQYIMMASGDIAEQLNRIHNSPY